MGQLLKTFTGHTEQIVSIDTDGSRLLTGARSDGVKLWDVNTGNELRDFQISDQDHVNSVAISPDGVLVAAGGQDNTVELWRAQTGERVGVVATTGVNETVAVLFANDGSFVLTTEGRRYNRFTLDLQPLHVHDTQLFAQCFSHSLSPNNRFVVSLHAGIEVDLVVYDLLNDVRTLQVPHAEGPAAPRLQGVTFAPDGATLFAGGKAGVPMLLSATTGSAAGTFAGPGHTKPITSVAVAPNGKFALTGSDDGTAKVWNMVSGKAVDSLRHEGSSFVSRVAFSPDSTLAFTAGLTDVKVWDLGGLV